MIELQHINVKLLLKEQEGINLELLIPVFHGWIQDHVFDELLIDVADYRHVPDGPGVMVIGHEADYSVDNSDGRLGVRYARKETLNNSSESRLAQAARSALAACQRLEQDERLDHKFQFNGRDIEIVINDRLLAPNHDENRKAVEPIFKSFADKLFDKGNYEITWQTDPRRLLGAVVKASKTSEAGELLKKL